MLSESKLCIIGNKVFCIRNIRFNVIVNSSFITSVLQRLSIKQSSKFPCEVAKLYLKYYRNAACRQYRRLRKPDIARRHIFKDRPQLLQVATLFFLIEATLVRYPNRKLPSRNISEDYQIFLHRVVPAVVRDGDQVATTSLSESSNRLHPYYLLKADRLFFKVKL